MNSMVLTATSVLLLAITTYAAVMPEYIKVCSRNDPQIGECIKNTVHSLRPYLKSGVTELNIPAMEPLYLGNLDILEGGASGINVKAKKLNINGASNFEIKKIKVSEGAKRLDFELLLPSLEGAGRYDINGQLLALPLRGSGPFAGKFTNFYAFVKLIFEVKKVNDIEYIAVKDLDVKIRTGKGQVRLENLFGGDKALGDVINETINQNFEVFTNELIGPIGRALSKKFHNIASKIVENFTYAQLFPVY